MVCSFFLSSFWARKLDHKKILTYLKYLVLVTHFFLIQALELFQIRAEFFKNSYQNSIGKAAESSVHILATGVNKRTKLVHFLLQKIRRPINFNLFYENIISNTIPVWTCFFSKITSINVTSPWTRKNTKIRINSQKSNIVEGLGQNLNRSL